MMEQIHNVGICQNRNNRQLVKSKSKYVLIVIFLIAGLYGCKQGSDQQPHLRNSIDAADSAQLAGLEGMGIYSDGWVGEEARVYLGNRQKSRGLSISGVNVMTGLKDEKLVLTVSFDDHAKQFVEVGSTGDFENIIVLPKSVAERETLAVTIVPSKVFVPSRLGTSQDDRRLSFRLRKIALVEQADLGKRFPEFFEFPREQEGEPYLRGVYKDGWIADSAVITLYNLNRKEAIEVRGVFPPDVFKRIAELQVYINGRLLVKEQLPKQQAGYFRIRALVPEDLIGQDKFVVALKPSGSFVPAERGINPDRRRISYQLQYIGLR